MYFASTPSGAIQKIVFWIREDSGTLSKSDYEQIQELRTKFSNEQCVPYFIICNELTNKNFPYYADAFANYFAFNTNLGINAYEFSLNNSNKLLFEKINREEYDFERDKVITDIYAQQNINVATYSCGTIKTKYVYFKWMQDIIEPICMEDSMDMLVYSKGHFDEIEIPLTKINTFRKISVETSLHKFVGGNILFGDDYLVFGADILLDNTDIYNLKIKPEQDVKKEIVKYLPNKHIYYVGDKNGLCLYNPKGELELSLQPFYHLDIYLTSLGKHETNEFFMIANLQDKYVFNYPEVIDSTNIDKVQYLEKIKAMLEECEASLVTQIKESGKQCEIIHIPIGFDFNSIDGKYIIQPVFSYNNCIVENKNGEILLYSPYFSSDSSINRPSQAYFDTLRIALYESLKRYSFIKIVEIKLPFTEMAYEEKYGLHCISKVLSRSPVSESND